MRSALFLLIATAALAGGASARAAEAGPGIVMAPGETITLEAGSKRITGSYVIADGQCDLTARISEAFGDGSTDTPRRALRVDATLAPGGASRIDTGAGSLLQFACKGGARAMTATMLGEARDFAGDRVDQTLAGADGQRLPMLRATGI
jgi:hypothetical protein